MIPKPQNPKTPKPRSTPNGNGFGLLLLSIGLLTLFSELTASAQQTRYAVIEGAFTWEEAKADAEARGGHLATITSQAEQDVVKRLASEGVLFLGGFQPPGSPEPSGNWQWVTGEPWSYQAWAGAEPNNNGGAEEDYLHQLMYADGKWNDCTNHGPGGYIIEFEEPRAARATAEVVNGFVVGVTVSDGGCGYTNAPIVVVVGGGGSGALVVATWAGGMVLTIVVVETGSGYTSVPTITIANPPFPARVAKATAQVVNGFVVGMTVSDGGYGYVSPPIVRLQGGGGLNAVATAVLVNSAVTEIIIQETGLSYTSAPVVWIEPPVLPVAKLVTVIATRLVYSGLTLGESYVRQVKVRGEPSGIWTSTDQTIVAQDRNYVESAVDSNKYRLVALPIPTIPSGALQIVNGFVVGFSLTDGGSGYTDAPVLTVKDSTGTGAILKPIFANGKVTGVTVMNPGRSYSPQAIVGFTPPPVVGIEAQSSIEARLELSQLLPQFRYQLQSSTDLKVFQPVGEVFVPQTATNAFYLDTAKQAEFYRLMYLH